MPSPASTEPPASRRVYEHVKHRLVDGSLEDGVLLSEGVVAKELEVSRTPVREAFLQLESEGLLRLYPKRGALVLGLGVREARELFAARLLVESDALRTVLGRPADPAFLAELAAIVAEQRALVDAVDPLAAAAADRRLHRAWVAAAGNAVLLRFYDGLRDRQDRMTLAMLRGGGPRPAELVEEHAAIVAAMRDGDGDRAVALLQAHLHAARAAAVDG